MQTMTSTREAQIAAGAALTPDGAASCLARKAARA